MHCTTAASLEMSDEPVKNGYVDQKIPYPDEDYHRYDIHMNGFGIGYIELMAMLNKVYMFINSLICNGRYNL